MYLLSYSILKLFRKFLFSPFFSRVENIDSIWTMEHCKQVRAMLPGGIDIHGIFVVSSENIQNNKKAKNVIDECCTVIQKVKRADNITDSSSTSTPLTFLQIDPKNHTTKADSWTTDQGISTIFLLFSGYNFSIIHTSIPKPIRNLKHCNYCAWNEFISNHDGWK